MDFSKASVIVCLTIFIVVGLNAMIYVSVTREKGPGTIELMRRAVGKIRNPWEDEEKVLAELSRLVSDLKGEEKESQD